MAAKQQSGVYAPDGSLYITLTDGNGTLATTGGAGVTVGTTTITSGTTGRVLYDNAGTIGEYPVTGTAGNAVLSISPTLTTPVLGVATGTSLALGGATVGSNALAVTGTSLLGNINLTPSVVSFITGGTGLALDTTVYFAAQTATGSRMIASGSSGFVVRSDFSYAFSSTTAANATPDVYLYRDAANTLAQRNGAGVAQTFNLYGSYTDASNRDYLSISKATGGDVTLAAQGAGSGTGGSLQFSVPVTAGAGVAATAVAKFNGGTGHLLWNTDNTYDIGASGATRPRNVYVAGTGTFGGATTIGGALTYGGVTLSNAVTGTGNMVLATRPTLAVTGTGFTLQDATDNTKQAQFAMSGISTGTTRTWTFPDVSGNFATTTSFTQTFLGITGFSAAVTFSGTSVITNGTPTTVTMGASTATSTNGLGVGATINGATKTINIGTAGVSGSITNINIGSAVGGATGTTLISQPTTHSGAVTAPSLAFSSTSGIIGTTTNDNAAAGSVGEFLSQSRSSGSASSVTTGTPLNITASTLDLTPGDWDISGLVSFVPAGTTTVAWLQGTISTTTAGTTNLETGNQTLFAYGGAVLAQTTMLPIGPFRVSISGNTSYFLVGNSSFGISTMTVYGFIRARRIR